MASMAPRMGSKASSESLSGSNNRDSNMVRASILNTALELGVGTNRTVTNWMFNGIDEEEEEEESTMSPALTSASTAASDDSVSTTQTGPGGFMDSGSAGRVQQPMTKPPVRVEFDLTRPPPTPDTGSPVPIAPQTSSGFLKSRFGKSKSKRDDGYETDGATTDSGRKKKGKLKKDKPISEGYGTDEDDGKSKKKSRKKENGEESDGGYLSDFARRRRKKKSKGKKDGDGGYETEGDGTPKKKDKESKGSPSPGEDTDGYLSEASTKRKKSFFRINGRSGSGSRNSPSSIAPPVPALPGVPPLPIAGRFTTDGDSRSETSLFKYTLDESNLQKVVSNDSSSSTRETTTREDTSVGHSSSVDHSIDHSSDHDSRSLELQPRTRAGSPLREEVKRTRFRFGSSGSKPSKNDGSDAGHTLPVISLPNSRTISPMPSSGSGSPALTDSPAASHRPTPLNLSVPSALSPVQGGRPSPVKSLGSEYMFVVPGGTSSESNTLPVSPALSDYSLVPSVPGAEYTNSSPQPSPRPLTPSHYDLPPPTPPPNAPLPNIPPQNTEIRAPKAAPTSPSSFLDFGAQSLPMSRSTSPLYSQPIPTIQRGKESPFPARPLLPPQESAELIQRTRSPVGRSALAMGYLNRPSERVQRGENLNEDGLDYLVAPPAPLVRSPSAIARMRPEVSVSSDVMSGINVNIEEASEAGDLDDHPELDSVISRYQDDSQDQDKELEPSIPARASNPVLSPGLRSPNSYRNYQSQPQSRIIRGSGPGSALEEEEEPKEYGEIEDEVVDDDDKSYYPQDGKTAGRTTMYMLENGEDDLRYSMYTDGDRTSRGSFLNEDKSLDARERFLRRVAAMYEETGREKPPPVPKLDPKLRAKFGG